MFTFIAPLLIANLTLVSRGEEVRSLLKEASQQSGIAMEAAPQTASEIVMVNIKDVSPDEFRTKLASVVGAEWKSEKGVWRLIRSKELEDRQILAERSTRVREIAEGMQILKDKRAATPPFDDAVAEKLAKKLAALYEKYKGHLSDAGGLNEMIPLEAEMPAGRLGAAILAKLSPGQIADVGPGDRIVFSTAPTLVQRQLPGDVTAEVNAYVAELAIFDKAIKAQKMAGEGFSQRFGLAQAVSAEDGSSLLMALARSPYNNSLTIDVHVADKQGNYVANSRSLLDVPHKEEPGAQLGDGKVALSAHADRFYKALQALQKGETFVKDKALIDEMKYPEKNDPLSYVAADGIFDLAKTRNMIACISDDAFAEPAFTAIEKDGTLNLKSFSKWVTDHSVVDASDQWFVVKPKAPIAVRTQRADRGALGAFFRGAILAGGASLSSMAEFATVMPRRYTDSIAPFFAFFLLPDLNAGITDRSVEMLRIYGRLNPQDQLALLAGKPLNFHLLNEASRADIADLVFRADPPISFMFRGAPPPGGVFMGSLKHEVTYVLANGVPNGAQITVNKNSTAAVIPDGGTSNYSPYDPMSPAMLGSVLAFAEKADPSDPRSQVNFKRFRLGSSTHYNFSLAINDSLAMNADVKENRFDRSAASLAYDELPADFRAQVERARAETREQQKSVPRPVAKTPPPR